MAKHSTSAWIESHVDVGRNRKILAFARTLGVPLPQAVGHLHLLWHAILEQQEDGIVTDWLPEELAQAARYQNSDPNAFRNALITENLLDESDGEFIVHDWFDYAGRYLTRKYSSHKTKRLKEIKQLYKVTPRRHRSGTKAPPREHDGDTLVDAPSGPSVPSGPPEKDSVSSSETPQKPAQARGKRTPAKKKPPSEHTGFIKWWCGEYEKARGVKYVFGGGRDAAAVKVILRELLPAEARIRAGRYLRDDDEFVEKQGHTLAFFRSRLNAYAQEHKEKKRGRSDGTYNPPIDHDTIAELKRRGL